MEYAKKQLKIISIVILALSCLDAANIVLQLIFMDWNAAANATGANPTALLVAQIILVAITALVLWPQLYIGLKGLKMAKTPDSSRAHIVWAKILFVLSLIGMISPLISIIKVEDLWENISQFCDLLVEVLVFFEFIKYAGTVAKAK